MLLEVHINHQKKPAVKRPEDDESGNDAEKGMDEDSNNVYLPASAQTESRLLGDCKKESLQPRFAYALYRKHVSFKTIG